MNLIHFRMKRVFADGHYSAGTALLALNPDHIVAVIDNGQENMADILTITGVTYRIDLDYKGVIEKLRTE